MSNPQASKNVNSANLLLLLGSILFTFLLCELATRFWYAKIANVEQIKKYGLLSQVPDSVWQIKPHHYLNYSLNPNFRKDSMSHNSLGYRGAEFDMNKANSTFRIVALGGSTTYTANVNDNELTYPAQLEKILRDTYNYSQVQVINAGAPGYNSWESLINLEFRVLDLDPDLLIIYHGTNDVHTRLIPPDTYQGDNSGFRTQLRYPKVSLYDKSALLRLLRRKLGYTTQTGLDPLVIRRAPGMLEWRKAETLKLNPPTYFRRNISSMIAICEMEGIQPVLATWAWSHKKKDYAAVDYYQKGFRENNKVLKELSVELNVPLFDFEALMPKDREHWADGRHVNEKGARLKAALFAKYLHEVQLIQ